MQSKHSSICVESKNHIYFSDQPLAEDIANTDQSHEDLLMVLTEKLGAFSFNTGFHCLA